MAVRELTGGNGSSGQTGLQTREIINYNFEELYEETIDIATSATVNFRADQASVCLLPDGNYLMAFGVVTGNIEDSGLFDIFICRSTDGGKTYSTPAKAFDRIGGFSTYIPSLFVRPDDSVYMIVLVQPTLITSELWKVESTDQGLTFSGTQSKIYGLADEYYAPASDRIYTLANGRRIFPFNKNTSPGNLGSQTGTYVGQILYSDNDTNSSATWQVAGTTGSNIIVGPDNLCAEPGIFLENNNTAYAGVEVYVCYYRTRSGYAYAARSTDNCITWAGGPTLFSTGLRAQNSTTTIIYDPIRRIYIAATNKYWVNGGFKNELLLWVSKDAKTWNFVTIIEGDLSASTILIFEPIIYIVGNLLKIVYTRSNAAVNILSLHQRTIPMQYVYNVAVEEYDSVTIKKQSAGTSSSFWRIFIDNVLETLGYLKFDNISGNGNVIAIWEKSRSKDANFGYLTSRVHPSDVVGDEWNYSTNESTGALTKTIQRIRNGAFNGSGGSIVYELFPQSILGPKGTTAQRPGTAATGLVTGVTRYNTDDNKMEYYNGTTWIQF